MAAKRSRFPYTVKRGSAQVKIYHYKRTSARVRGRKSVSYDEFTVAYYLGSKRKKETFSTFNKALTFAEIKAAELSRGEVDAVMFSGSDRLAYGQALETLKPTKVDLNSAVSEYAQAKKILGGYSIAEASRYFMRHHSEELIPKPVKDVVNEIIQKKTKAGLSDVYLADLRYRLGQFAEDFVCKINQTTSEQIELWLDGLDLSARSHNNHLRTLNTFFNFAKTRKYLSKDYNPLEGILRRKQKAKSVPVFSAKELARLLECAADNHPDYLPCLALGAFAGFRQSEILRLSWEDIERAPGFVEAEANATKTQRRRLVEIKPVLEKWLAVSPRQSPKVWPHSRHYLNEVRAENAEQAKVKWKDNGLRHTWVSCRLAETESADKTALEAGNSPQMVFSNYRELRTPAQAKAWFSVEPAGGGKIVSIRQSKSA